MSDKIKPHHLERKAILYVRQRWRIPGNSKAFFCRGIAGQIPNTTAGYAAVYGTVPTPQNAPPPVRDMIDMTDVAAQDVMERAIAIDAIAD